jgi:hypothetical protein
MRSDQGFRLWARLWLIHGVHPYWLVVRLKGAIVSVNAGDTHDPINIHDRVINHIFVSGLTLTSILSRHRLDDEVAERLRDVIAELDAAVGHLRRAALTLVVEDRARQPSLSGSPVPANWRRRLCRFSLDEVFAYAVAGHDFYRASDDALWAHESDGLLMSARSGTILARRDGRVFYDIESDVPLYYEDRRAEPLSEDAP